MPVPVINETRVKSILSKSNLPVCDYAANPYTGCTHGCRYCYASFMKRFTGHREEWGTFLDIKYWDSPVKAERYRNKEVFIGSVTDPYLPEEERFCRTRTLLEELSGSGVRISISTKSDLILRDLDLISRFPGARVAWSVNTLDEEFHSDMDRAVPVRRRLEAMKAFHDAGVRTTLFISPIFPGLTDVTAIIREGMNDCNLIWLENLNLRGGFRKDIMDYIRSAHPEILPLYEDIYVRGDKRYWEALDNEIRGFAGKTGLEYVVNDDSLARPFDAKPVIVNYFYHEKIRKNAARDSSIEISNISIR